MTVKLSQAERDQIFRTLPEERRNGGFQSFMVKLQDRMGEEGELELNSVDLATIQRYATYDNGGYEGRLRKAFGRHLPKIFPGQTHDLFAA